jgi:Protein of unknown function, DUF481
MRPYVLFLPLGLFFLFPSISALAIDNESDREAIVSAKSKKFYKSNRARQYLSFGGNYNSNQSSKNYELTSRYLYQNNRFINEFNFQHESKYANLGSTAGKTYLVKKSELYDASASSKALLFDTKNYGVFYHRTIYDDMSKYYRDQRTAVGLGKMFFDDRIEFDTSLGYQDVAAYGYKLSVIPSLRIIWKINDKLSFNQRAYLFVDHESMDNDFKTSLIYRINEKMSFEIRHTFEQRRYEDDSPKQRRTENQVYKSITFGLVLDLG